MSVPIRVVVAVAVVVVVVVVVVDEEEVEVVEGVDCRLVPGVEAFCSLKSRERPKSPSRTRPSSV